MANGEASRAAAARAAKVKAVHLATFQKASERTVEIMQTTRGAGGNMRVDTGFLRASGQGQLNNPNFTVMANPGGKFTYNGDAVSLVIASAKIGDRIYFAYTANYARAREYGSRGQAGDAFRGLAVQRWPQVVRDTYKEARGIAGI